MQNYILVAMSFFYLFDKRIGQKKYVHLKRNNGEMHWYEKDDRRKHGSVTKIMEVKKCKDKSIKLVSLSATLLAVHSGELFLSILKSLL